MQDITIEDHGREEALIKITILSLDRAHTRDRATSVAARLNGLPRALVAIILEGTFVNIYGLLCD